MFFVCFIQYYYKIDTIKPENVKSGNFKVDKILFNNGNFSIAFGTWKNESKVLAARWNGDITDEKDKGYPKTFGNPMWLIIDDEIKLPMLKSIIGIKGSDNQNIISALTETLNA